MSEGPLSYGKMAVTLVRLTGQPAMYWRAHRKIADRNEVFMDIMTGPNPLSPEEIDRLVEKDPARYGAYARWGTKKQP